ncbi:hypothetical protein BH09CHL1_BH09CHL1_11670 [soil metagenome]
MRALVRSTRVLFASLMIAGLLAVGGFGNASAASGAYITLHVFECPSGGDDLFAACHSWDNNAIDGASFKVAGSVRDTDWGWVQWKPGAGWKTISALDFVSPSYVFCSNQVTGAVLYDGRTTSNAVGITTTAGQEVICDWYLLAWWT